MKRHRLQFRLRALLVATTLLAAWLAAVTNRAREQRRIVAELNALGWGAFYDWQVGGRLTEPPGPAWLRRIIGDDYFQKVIHVSTWTGEGRELDESRTAESIPLLQRLPALKAVLYWPPIPKRSEDALRAALPGRCVDAGPPA